MSSSSSPAPSAGQSAPNEKQKANQIGHSFITTYYHTLSENTNTCFKFYKNNSQLSHEPDVTYNNSNDIKEYYFSGCKFAGALINLEHGNFDIQPSFGGGVLICITGHMTLKENTDDKKSFVHTFFLGCENVNVAGGATKQRYYVLNEVLRFVEAPVAVPLPVQDVDDIIDATEDDNADVSVNVAEETDSKHNGDSSMVIQRGEEETKDEILVSDEAKLVEEMTNLTTEPFAATTDPAVGDLDEKDKTTSVNGNDPVVAMETVSAVESAQLEELSAVEQVALSNTPIAAVQAEPSKPKSWAALLSSSPARSSSSSAANVAASSSSNNAKLFRKLKPVDGSATDVKASLAEGITESSQKEVMNKEAAEAATVVPGTGGRTASTSMSSGDRNFGACSLYVSNVNRDVSEKGLRELFGKYGFRIVNVTVAQTRGFGFIDFSDPNAADVILKQGGNTYTLNGRQITVEKKDIGRARGGRSGKNGSSRRSSPRGGGGGHKSRSSRGGKNKGGSHSGGNKQGQSAASSGNGGSGGGES
uniref:NTF2 domain-containing protein n=1 Tax=Leptocylindrus danicus TaxID=163516 RepID=A0A7S2K5F5_9STRA|mmetsp:Transcript_18089/g.26885  ORF Transcript_18089/g.26885 Transcript_18089/m.26885 type:complete len:532 (+) Transcript_18089:209-1804(+)|eukprot:CAMPEP_0116035672 /NCGR_PEP_ID=MMETSP0321-20121206/20549_1 /TAXON_ID=163516 /ORGANISM="Leptocylindrus danicus var. danicus, Strain B650" /LENGTH=531 /DNA_ID=CAMNT_0003512633 /DNA_START=194 /DNA_END=1789 /DNA_ORIENTATION=-